jgi:hypothetical protein
VGRGLDWLAHTGLPLPLLTGGPSGGWTGGRLGPPDGPRGGAQSDEQVIFAEILAISLVDRPVSPFTCPLKRNSTCR